MVIEEVFNIVIWGEDQEVENIISQMIVERTKTFINFKGLLYISKFTHTDNLEETHQILLHHFSWQSNIIELFEKDLNNIDAFVYLAEDYSVGTKYLRDFWKKKFDKKTRKIPLHIKKITDRNDYKSETKNTFFKRLKDKIFHKEKDGSEYVLSFKLFQIISIIMSLKGKNSVVNTISG